MTHKNGGVMTWNLKVIQIQTSQSNQDSNLKIWEGPNPKSNPNSFKRNF